MNHHYSNSINQIWKVTRKTFFSWFLEGKVPINNINPSLVKYRSEIYGENYVGKYEQKQVYNHSPTIHRETRKRGKRKKRKRQRAWLDNKILLLAPVLCVWIRIGIYKIFSFITHWIYNLRLTSSLYLSLKSLRLSLSSFCFPFLFFSCMAN